MSMNKYMHPRNIYKSPPNFKQLALEYPDFGKFLQQNISGKVSLDFKNLESLRALSCVLLKKDFGLDVEMPLTKLIPTIPLRLNYILWVEDLLELVDVKDVIRGIDIGTGASCVYPLLGAKKNNWHFTATEVDGESVRVASENIKRNNLENLIKIVEIKSDTLIEDVVRNEEYDFCMCNPPFFSGTHELHPFLKSRTKNRPHPKNAFCASENEVVAKGGEVEFITRLINESKQLGNKVKIYTTMLGHKNSLPKLKQLLRDVGVHSFKDTNFCQGNTTRWGLAWTFENIDLRKVVDPVKTAFKVNKPKPSVTYQIPLDSVDETSLSIVTEKLMDIFKSLKFVCEEVLRKKNILRYFVSAFSNTWANQRRKRRQQCLNSSDETNSSFEEGMKSVENNNVSEEKCSNKRGRDENLAGTLMKKLRLSSKGSESGDVFFKFVLSIKQENNSVTLELNCNPEFDNRDYLYQILQYIKNNYKV